MIQTHDKCKYFSFKSCYHSENEIMKQFILNTDIPESGVPIIIDDSLKADVDKLCADCSKFKPLS